MVFVARHAPSFFTCTHSYRKTSRGLFVETNRRKPCICTKKST